MFDARIDDNITKLLLDNSSIFENIHPNTITIFGMILNIVIFKMLYSNEITATLLIVFALRYIADCLDGGVARKYNKQSKIGGILDTLSDIILAMTMIYFLCIKFNIPFYIYTILIIYGLIATTNQYDLFNTHEKIKQINNNSLDIIPFLINNTFIFYFIFLFIKYYL